MNRIGALLIAAALGVSANAEEKCNLACEISASEKSYVSGGELKLKSVLTVTGSDSYVYNPFLDRRLPHLPRVTISGPKGADVLVYHLFGGSSGISFGSFKDPDRRDWQRLGHGNVIGNTLGLTLPENLPTGKYSLVIAYSSVVASSPPRSSEQDEGWREALRAWQAAKYRDKFLVSEPIVIDVIKPEK